MAAVHGLRWTSSIFLVWCWSHSRVLAHAAVVWVAHLLWWLLLLRLRRLLLSLHWIRGSCTCLLASGPLRVAATAFLARHNIDEEVEHVTFRECGGDVTALQGATFVVFSMYPGTHCQLGNEDVASFGEKDWCFGRDHFYFWIGLHDFLYARKWQLVNLKVVRVGFEVVDGILPVGG